MDYLKCRRIDQDYKGETGVKLIIKYVCSVSPCWLWSLEVLDEQSTLKSREQVNIMYPPDFINNF